MEPHEMAMRAQERFAKIRRDPEKALFSEYKGVSPSGVATVWVDLMGKIVRLQLAPNSLYEGAESWLTTEIMAAHDAAKKAAEVLDFDMADLVREVDDAIHLKQRMDPADGNSRQPGTDGGRGADGNEWHIGRRNRH
jgi:DNA-binding protein YbaB